MVGITIKYMMDWRNKKRVGKYLWHRGNVAMPLRMAGITSVYCFIAMFSLMLQSKDLKLWDKIFPDLADGEIVAFTFATLFFLPLIFMYNAVSNEHLGYVGFKYTVDRDEHVQRQFWADEDATSTHGSFSMGIWNWISRYMLGVRNLWGFRRLLHITWSLQFPYYIFLFVAWSEGSRSGVMLFCLVTGCMLIVVRRYLFIFSIFFLLA